MKKTTYYLSCLLVAFSLTSTSFAQVDKKMELDFLEYNRLIIEKNFEQALNYAHPKMFELIPRAQMKAMLESVFASADIEYKIGMPIITEASPPRKIDDVHYVRFKTKSVLEMKMKEKGQETLKISEMRQAFEAAFGEGNVHYRDDTGFFVIQSTKTAIGSVPQGANEWKFVVIDHPRMIPFLETILPKELLVEK